MYLTNTYKSVWDIINTQEISTYPQLNTVYFDSLPNLLGNLPPLAQIYGEKKNPPPPPKKKKKKKKRSWASVPRPPFLLYLWLLQRHYILHPSPTNLQSLQPSDISLKSSEGQWAQHALILHAAVPLNGGRSHFVWPQNVEFKLWLSSHQVQSSQFTNSYFLSLSPSVLDGNVPSYDGAI